jgi:hypothetical protein
LVVLGSKMDCKINWHPAHAYYVMSKPVSISTFMFCTNVPRKWRQYVPVKHWSAPMRIHGVDMWKTTTWTFTTIKTSSLYQRRDMQWMLQILNFSVRKLCSCHRTSQISAGPIYRARHVGFKWLDNAEYFDSNSEGRRNPRWNSEMF